MCGNYLRHNSLQVHNWTQIYSWLLCNSQNACPRMWWRLSWRRQRGCPALRLCCTTSCWRRALSRRRATCSSRSSTATGARYSRRFRGLKTRAPPPAMWTSRMCSPLLNRRLQLPARSHRSSRPTRRPIRRRTTARTRTWTRWRRIRIAPQLTPAALSPRRSAMMTTPQWRWTSSRRLRRRPRSAPSPQRKRQ